MSKNNEQKQMGNKSEKTLFEQYPNAKVLFALDPGSIEGQRASVCKLISEALWDAFVELDRLNATVVQDAMLALMAAGKAKGEA
jgi:hypothetical protein